MTDNLITWSVKNWITVFLMWLLGWAVLSFVARVATNKWKMPNAADTPAGVVVGNPTGADPQMV